MSSERVIDLREALLAGIQAGPTALSRQYDAALEALEAPDMKYAIKQLNSLREFIECESSVGDFKPGETVFVKEFASLRDVNNPSKEIDFIPYGELVIFVAQKGEYSQVIRTNIHQNGLVLSSTLQYCK